MFSGAQPLEKRRILTLNNLRHNNQGVGELICQGRASIDDPPTCRRFFILSEVLSAVPLPLVQNLLITSMRARVGLSRFGVSVVSTVWEAALIGRTVSPVRANQRLSVWSPSPELASHFL